MNPKRLYYLTLANRSKFLDLNDEQLGDMGINRLQVEDSIEKYFDFDKLATDVRCGTESYSEIADYVAGYLKSQSDVFPFGGVYTTTRDEETIKLITSLRNVGLGTFADPIGYTGSTREFQSSILAKFSIIGATGTSIPYLASISHGENPFFSVLICGLAFGYIGIKMFKDTINFLEQEAKEIPIVAKKSDEFIYSFR